MHRLACLVALAAVLFATAWGRPKGTFNYEIDVTAAVGDTALIRPALKAEKRFNTSTARKIFFGGEAVLQLNAIAHGYEMPGSADIRKFENVRVAPGHYLLVVICRSSTAVGRFDLKVDAVAGGEYLVECSGAGNTTRAHVWRKDQPAVEAPVATEMPAAASTQAAPAQQ